MSPRIAFWTSAFDADMEAIASEVALLRRHHPRSVAWGLSHRCWARLSWRHGYRVHPCLHLVFRLATRVLEPAFQLNHVFGSAGDWFYLQSKKRRPTVLTVAAQGPPVSRELLQRVDRFVVEHPQGVEELARSGVERERTRVILPPVDLRRFAPTPPPPGPFTVLFASSPDKASWLEARGLPPLLDAAERRPGMLFRLLWRPWGDSAPRVRQWIADRGLANVRLEIGKCGDMAGRHQAAHVCIAPFTDASRSKPAPNSILESLACGRPVLVTPTVGLADVIRESGAGRVSAACGAELAEHLDCLQADWQSYSRRARELAERRFSEQKFLTDYENLYRELIPA